ncbi:hypothetical protein NKR23_g11673 [Pleurostoma richardsiae]|uniref:Uncharacterized protein n=1 Tax=Pleurostoma richardsiae TaxID=41990 RepID=A0AA38R3F9_9PEZI|nr:hypothetical protein NKR23_g11673 [Pleurostoma richardsiae]
MQPVGILLRIGIGILMLDALLELAFISSMVFWLNHGASGPYETRVGDSTFFLHSAPLHLLTDQGHTSNGAAGTAFVLIGLGGILALLLRRSRHGILALWYRFWLVLTVPAVLLTLAALIYVNVVTRQHAGQVINVAVASTLDARPYPLKTWTPDNWFSAVLKLDLVRKHTADTISHHLRIIHGWRWNLIPLFITELFVCILAFLDALTERRGKRPPSSF